VNESKHWDRVAAGWDRWHGWTEEHFRPVTDWLRAHARWTGEARVLDVGCGAGYPALTIAQEVGPDGRVVAIDISRPMLAVAAEQADARRLRNIEFRQQDAEDLHFDDGSIDVVINTYALMFCGDPGRALREARRVLRPGGRAAIVVWDDPARSSFFSTINAAAQAALGWPTPSAGARGPFLFAPPRALETLAEQSGFHVATLESVTMTLGLESADEYVQLFRDVAWKARLEQLSTQDLERFTDTVGDSVQTIRNPAGGLQLTATSRCALLC
jgi:enediyne biosynthesis protein CalE5